MGALSLQNKLNAAISALEDARKAVSKAQRACESFTNAQDETEVDVSAALTVLDNAIPKLMVFAAELEDME